MAERSFAIIQGRDLWQRVAYRDTALEPGDAVVRLAYAPEPEPAPEIGGGVDLPQSLGLARDPWCRLYVAFPQQGRLLRLTPRRDAPAEVLELFGSRPVVVGDFFMTADPQHGLTAPVALAIDDDGRLFVAERLARRIRVFDLVDRRLLRTILLADEPTALACDGRQVLVLTNRADRIGRLDAIREPVFETLPQVVRGADGLVLDHRGRPLLLLARGLEEARVVRLASPGEALHVPRASALAWRGDDELVVARAPGEPFRRFRLRQNDLFEDAGLDAPGYAGDGILVDHENRILYWTESGLARARPTRRRFRPSGRVTGFALDSGRFQTQWGRLFVDACIPKGTRIRVHCLALDEVPPGSLPLARTPPANALTLTIPHPHLSPAMPPKALIDDAEPAQALHRRRRGPELPWIDPVAAAPFETFEAPVIAEPGRWLWVVLELTGGARATPRVRGLRVEHQGHDWMRRLPRIYGTEPAAADFLRRWLALLEGEYHGLELQAAARHMLLDPSSAPSEALPWLAGFVGLALDRRWPEPARRTLIREANWLFRFRGTVPGLKRMLAIYLGRDPEIIEHFKVRGLGGALVGSSDALASNSVLGAGFRVGGTLGAVAAAEVSINAETLSEAIDAAAHRFTLVLPVLLDTEQRALLEQILALHRPAHTLYDVCSLEAGMRLGIALYAGLTSLIGRGPGFGSLQVGGSLLGRRDLVGGGPPAFGSAALVGASQLGVHSAGLPNAGGWSRACGPVSSDTPETPAAWVDPLSCGGDDG